MEFKTFLYVTAFFTLLSTPATTTSLPFPSVLWSESSGRWSKFKSFLDWNDQPILQSERSTIKYAYTRPINKASNWTIAFNHRNKFFYWLDPSEPSKIFKQSANQSFDWTRYDAPLVVDLTNQNVHMSHLVVDWTTDNLYVTDPYSKAIVLIGKGNRTRNMVSTEGTPGHLCIEPSVGLLFWSEYNTDHYRIMRSDTMGSNISEVVVRATSITGMCLWKKNNKLMLLWIEPISSLVMSCDVGGNDVREMYIFESSMASYKAAAVFKNHVFLTNERAFSIDVISLSTRSLIQSFEIDALPYDIIADVTSTDSQSKDEHECVFLACEHMCVNVGGGRGVCVCMDGYNIALDGVSCEVSDFLFIYTTEAAINSAHASAHLSIKQPTNLNISIISLTTHRGAYDLLACHHEGGRLFYSTTSTGSIYNFNVRNNRGIPKPGAGGESDNGGDDAGGGEVREVTAQIGKVTGLAVNWRDGLLLWMDGQMGCIMSSRMDGRYHSIIRINLIQPTALAVDPYEGILFWSQSTNSTRHVCSGPIKRDTRQQDVCFVEVAEGGVEDIVYDSRHHRLYISSSQSQTIVAVDMHTKALIHYHIPSHSIHRFTLFQNLLVLVQGGGQPLSFVIHPTANHNTSDLLSTNKNVINDKINIINNLNNNTANNNNNLHYSMNTLDTVSFLTQGPRQVTWDGVNDVISYNNYLQPSLPISTCFQRNPCKHLCTSAPSTQQCLCAIGYHDDEGCSTEVLKSTALYFLDTFHKQVYQLSLSQDALFQPLTPSSSYIPPSSLTHIHSYPHPQFDSPLQFLVNKRTQILYILSASRLQAFNPQQNKLTDVFSTDPQNKLQVAITRSSFDAETNKIFMTSLATASIYVVEVGEGGGKMEVWKDGLVQPYAIHVSERSRSVYWSEGGSLMYCRSQSQPTNVTTINISTNISSIYDYSCDESYCGYVYVSDTEERKIYRVNVTKHGNTHDQNRSNDNDQTNSNFRKKRSDDGSGVGVVYDFSKGDASLRDVHINSLFIHKGYLYFSATNKKTVYRFPLADPTKLESFPLRLFAGIGGIQLVQYISSEHGTSVEVSSIIIGAVAGFLLLLLLLALLCFLCCSCHRRRRNLEKLNLATASTATSATTLPSNSSYAYEVDGDMLGSNEVMHDHMFLPGPVLANGTKASSIKEVSELTLNVETIKSNTNDTLKANGSVEPLVKAPTNGQLPILNSLREARNTIESRPLPRIPPPLTVPVPPPPYSCPPPPPPPPFLKNSSKNSTDSPVRNISPTPKTPSENTKAPISVLGGPPKLHTQARGFAPASHARPAPVKSTWGRNKFKNNA